MSDEGFQLPSPLAAAALQTSKCVLSWSRDPNNHHIFEAFANSLHAKLHKAFEVPARKFQRRREKMWGSYHSIRCSDDFVDSWKRFLAKAFCVTATPIFYQHITDRIFRKMMKVAFPVAESSKTVIPSPISNSELNALRYAAGYVCRTVRKRIKRMKPVNVQLKLSLEELLEDDSAGCNADVCGSSKSSGKNNRECDDDVGGDAVDNCDGDGDSSNDDESDGGTSDAGGGEGDSDGNCDGDDHGDGGNGAICSEADCATPISSTRQWIQIVNRGGLLHVTDDAFDLFVAIEKVVRTYYCKSKIKEVSGGRRTEIMEVVMKDEEVLTEWSNVAVDMEEDIGGKLLKMVVEEWVKIRGFSFAHAWLEKYKQDAKKTLQRSKGLRKTLLSATDMGPQNSKV